MLVISLLAACGGNNEPAATQPPANTPLPAATSTPRSTALPAVPTPVPVGSEERPLALAFVAENNAANQQAAAAMAEALVREMRNFRFGGARGLQLDVELLGSRSEAIDLLCNGGNTAVFVDIFTYAAAAERCNIVPVLRVQRGTGANRSTGTNFEFVTNTNYIILTLRFLSGTAGYNERFCTMSLTDLEGFVHPALVLRAIAGSEEKRQALRPVMGVDIPIIDLLEFNETIPQAMEIVLPGEDTFTTDVEMVQGLQLGPGNIPRLCESLALPVGRFEEIVAELEAADTELRGIAVFPSETTLRNEQITEANRTDLREEIFSWPEIPYEVLVFPPEALFPEPMREEVVRALTTLEEADEDVECVQRFVPGYWSNTMEARLRQFHEYAANVTAILPFIESERPPREDEDEEEEIAFRCRLNSLVVHDVLIEVGEDEFAEFQAWLREAGWNMAAPIH